MYIENNPHLPTLIDDVSGFAIGRGELLRLGKCVFVYDGLERLSARGELTVALLDERDGQPYKLWVEPEDPDLRMGPLPWED
jgi:hypothetical protein